MLDPLAAGFKIHYVTRAELENNNGVCAQCAAKFSKSHKSVVSGKRIEKPVDLNERHEQLDVEHDHAGFVAPGAVGQTVDFDLYKVDTDTTEFFANAIDRGNPLALTEAPPQASRHEAAAALRELLAWCWRDGRLAKRPESGFVKFVAMSAAVCPQLLDGFTYEQIAAKLGVTKACLSKQAVLFQDHFKLKFRRSRTLEQRQRMADAQFGHKPTNTKKRTSNQTVTNEPAEGGGQAEGGAAL